MTEVSREILQEVLKHYKPECRTLKSASINYPVFRGEFVLGPSFYHVPSLNHATDIEIQLCLNQLAYAGIAEVMKQELIPELERLDFSELRNEGMLIIESRKRFRRPIKTSKIFYGQIRLEDWRDFGRLIIGHASFDFERRSCFGNLEFALVKPGETQK